MSQPFIGEIRMFGGNFPPQGWAFCSGQTLMISQNDALFNLIGTTYGGDGQQTFNLPNLQSRIPIHAGTDGENTYTLGETGGVETITLTTQQIPLHSHVPQCQSANGSASPASGVWAASPSQNIYTDAAPSALMNAGTMVSTGGSQPHDNMIPFLVVSFIISLFGVFPSQN